MKQTHTVRLGALVSLLAAACTGHIATPEENDSSKKPEDEDNQIVVPPGDKGGDPIVLTKPSFACDASTQVESIGFRKLTGRQYRNTLRDITRFALGDEAATLAALAAIADKLDRYPEDEPAVVDSLPTYRQANQAMQQLHMDTSYDIALALGKYLTGDNSRLGKVAGACATDGTPDNDRTCVVDFITRFGPRALRQPLNDGDVEFYQGFYGDTSKSDPLAWADLIAGFLTAPQFLYFIEHGTDAIGGKSDTYKLSAHELAARLSYHFLHTMPDETLWKAAESGALLDEAEYGRQVDRLMKSSAARNAGREFFEDFLHVTELPALDNHANDNKFELFAGKNQPSGMLRQAMIDDALAMVDHHVWDREESTLDDLLTSEQSFATTAELANIYGVEVWDGKGTPPLFPSEQGRKGLFTRAAFMASGLSTTRPIIKGSHLRQYWLCDEVPPPTPGAENTPVDTTNLRTRDAVEAITEQDGSGCKSCHQAFLNPLGFATENFDALGRFRSEEMLFDGDEHTGFAPVNATTVPRVFLDDPREVTGAGELMSLVAESGKVHACMARGYFQYTFARPEDPERDGCALESLRKAISGQGTLQTFVREAALLAEFRERTIPPRQ